MTIVLETQRQQGSTLLLVMVLLLVLGVFGLAALDAATSDLQMAGFQNRRQVAFYAAEAGLAEGFETLTTAGAPTVSTATIGDAGIHPHGQPGYRPDPAATAPIEPVGTGALPNTSLNIGQGGVPTYQISYWRMQVEGNANGGSMARVEAVGGALIAN